MAASPYPKPSVIIASAVIFLTCALLAALGVGADIGMSPVVVLIGSVLFVGLTVAVSVDEYRVARASGQDRISSAGTALWNTVKFFVGR